MVPQQLKEEEFWTQFFQSQFLHHESKSQQFLDCLSPGQLNSKYKVLHYLLYISIMFHSGGSGTTIPSPETPSTILGEEVSVEQGLLEWVFGFHYIVVPIIGLQCGSRV